MNFYAQRGEDQRLADMLDLPARIQNNLTGFYVDVGAWEPTFDSVTKIFYDAGWHGINIEPNPYYFQLLQTDRPRDINLPLAAGAKHSVETMTVAIGTGLSTFVDEYRPRVEAEFEARRIDVTVRPLSYILETCVPMNSAGLYRLIDFMKIDCEGYEEQVLLGMDFKRFRPIVLCIEARKPCTEELSVAWEPILTAADYELVGDDGLNRWYLAK